MVVDLLDRLQAVVVSGSRTIAVAKIFNKKRRYIIGPGLISLRLLEFG